MRFTEEDIEIARFCLEEAKRHGAADARVSLSKCVSDTYSMRDGELDSVNHSADCGISIGLFVDGRRGNYSTNRMEKDTLSRFIRNAVASTRLLAEEKAYRLPDADRCAKNATEGTEMGLFDEKYYQVTDQERLRMSKATCLPKKKYRGEGWKVVNCESEYMDSISDSITMDTHGFFGRASETTFMISCEITIEDREGNKYNAYDWDADSFMDKLPRPGICAENALKTAISQMNPGKSRGGRRKMVVDRKVASKLVAPIMNALYDSSLINKTSFLMDKQDQKVFSGLLTLMDFPMAKGLPGARLFDFEGVATEDRPIIENGVIKTYFVTTYYSEKLNIPPTVSSPSVPTLMPCAAEGMEMKDEWDLDAIVKAVGNGVLVTGFNGGNCNDTTGDFSYGIEGFTIKNGKIGKPVHEMLITGNFLELWNHLLAAGNDPRRCTRWQLPTLAFEDVSFSA
ncbi:MAG: TldD/PmbA family protein [Bacteroidales bacterium]|nr:TldD/PmbA family protein [Bacteroidales bacterium]